jgi:hypothetical protein
MFDTQAHGEMPQMPKGEKETTMEPAVTTGTKPRPRVSKQTPRETGGSSAPPRASRRKAAEFNVPIKLWVTQEMYDALDDVAREREWSIPQVIRRVVKTAIGERKLG